MVLQHGLQAAAAGQVHARAHLQSAGASAKCSCCMARRQACTEAAYCVMAIRLGHLKEGGRVGSGERGGGKGARFLSLCERLPHRGTFLRKQYRLFHSGIPRPPTAHTRAAPCLIPHEPWTRPTTPHTPVGLIAHDGRLAQHIGEAVVEHAAGGLAVATCAP